MMFSKVLCVLLFVSVLAETSKTLTDKVVDQLKKFKSEEKQISYMTGYHQGRTHEKLERLLGLGLNRKGIAQQRLQSRLEALEKLVKKHKKENDRKFLEMNDENRTISFTVSTSSNLHNRNNWRIIYDKVITNKGNAYNKTTGIFTCPVSGTYVFTWSTMAGNDKQICSASIYHNGSKKMVTYSSEGKGGYHEVASNTIVLSLKLNDQVWIWLKSGGYCYGYPNTGFSGWKL